jgi:hypothetical protein
MAFRTKEQAKKYRDDHLEESRKTWRIYYDSHRQELANKRSAYNRSAKGKYKQLRNDPRGFEMTLTFEAFEILNSLPCHYCGGELPESGYGLDRINPLLGYIPGNVVPCCETCNIAKSNLTELEFRNWAMRLFNHWASKD